MEKIRELGPGGANGGMSPGRGRRTGETEGAGSSRSEAAASSIHGGDGDLSFAGGTDFLRGRFAAVAGRLEDLLERHTALRSAADAIRGNAEKTPEFERTLGALEGEIAGIEQRVSETQVAFQNILTASTSENLDIGGLMGEGDVTIGLNLQAMAIGHDNVLKLLEG
ncbi:MAG: hypothetical protein A2Z34_02195 [Planctomycetes bacterium RBG_16_59_8]|nr:MAG: hypothetical protein A2Z34_02195 [Planctomycetes bacterium RBG_16_59_8]